MLSQALISRKPITALAILASAVLAIALSIQLVSSPAKGAVSTHSSTERFAAGRSSQSTVAPCVSSDLTLHFWMTMPSMGADMQGFNLINVGSLPCELPLLANVLGVDNQSGTLQPSVSLSSPSGMNSFTDFVGYGSANASDYVTPPIGVNNVPIVLNPGAEAVEVLFTSLSVDGSTDQGACLNGPIGGSMSIALGTDDDVAVTIPSSTNLVSGMNPAGSAFDSCEVVLESPLLTWDQAVALVGPPPSSTSQTPAVSDGTIYQYAP